MGNKRLYESVVICKGTLTKGEYRQALNSIIRKIKNITDIKKLMRLD